MKLVFFSSVTAFFLLNPSAGVAHGKGKFVSFDPPGSVYTQPYSINLSGEVAGLFFTFDSDGNLHEHGFIRSPKGQFTIVDAPNDIGGTGLSSINDEGVATGRYCTDTTCYAFVWEPDGRIETFSLTGEAGSVTGCSTINNLGVVACGYVDAQGINGTAFLRAASGTITVFNAPGAGAAGTYVVEPTGLNDEGIVSGGYYDSSGNAHNAIRYPNGAFAEFDIPGYPSGGYPAGTDLLGRTIGVALTPAGIAAPFPSCPGCIGYIRSANGSISFFQAPSAVFNFPNAVNAVGASSGWYGDAQGVTHGFVRDAAGNFTTIDAPGTSNQFTIGFDNNLLNVVTGWFQDVNYVQHGFVWYP